MQSAAWGWGRDLGIVSEESGKVIIGVIVLLVVVGVTGSGREKGFVIAIGVSALHGGYTPAFEAYGLIVMVSDTSRACVLVACRAYYEVVSLCTYLGTCVACEFA